MPMGVFIPVRTVERCACVRIYTAWVSALLIRDDGFSQDLYQRISKRRDPRFLMLGTEPVIHSPHLNNDPPNAGELLRWDFLYNCL